MKKKVPHVDLHRLFLGLQEQMVASLSTSRESVAHPATKGDATEIHWLDMFNRYLPERYSANKAFVVDSGGNLSQQCDVVIYDRQYSPFLFNQDSAKYVPAESVYAAFEVKQDISANEISHHGRTDSSSVGRTMENKKTDFHFAVRGLRCESLKTNGAEPQAKGESVQ